ncbi:helix-turn-helix transcriptional regulator [Natrinema salifodinae]|uniref:IclR helix-turn-helix domain-containing protein n=1 Tax=Natrinema salifodinae TaxID=1202768 RepID=A0A1I0QCJ6_9EURY|nr:hypothetical protein [Natrinema salifodinae]SEW24657.1 hypothetical protein SAMN05216285_3373 [Natrinema salifodinae]
MDARGLRVLLWVLVVVVCSFALVPSQVAAASVADPDTGAQRAALQDDQAEELNLEDADQINIDVFITENGTAQVTVDYQFLLNEENSSETAWNELESDIDSNSDAYADAEHEKWNETLVEGENRTGREEMEISNVTVTTDRDTAPRDIGHATVTFEWSSFALVELNRIEAGAALSGFTLDDGTALQFRWPDDYSVYVDEGEPQVDPTPSDDPDGSVVWNGDETTFTDEQPRIVLIEDGNTSEEPAGTDEGPAMPWAIVALALALLATVGAAGWLLGRRRPGGGVEAGNGAQAETAHRTDGATGGESESDGPDGPPPELLSNEERVLRLLQERGGRIKQQEVVSELDWTEAKTSQVVGDLRENDEIDVFRIGRENVLALPEEESE